MDWTLKQTAYSSRKHTGDTPVSLEQETEATIHTDSQALISFLHSTNNQYIEPSYNTEDLDII